METRIRRRLHERLNLARMHQHGTQSQEIETQAGAVEIKENADMALIQIGADKAYDAEDFVNELRSMRVTPHVAQNTSGRSSAIDGPCAATIKVRLSVNQDETRRRGCDEGRA